MKDFCCVLIVAALVISCATVGEKSQTDDGATGLSVDFFNASSFDRKMSSALRGNPPTVTVNLLAPTTLNTIPDRLGSWLTMVENNHGTVELQDDSGVRTRGILDPLSMAFGGLVMLYKMVENKFMYGPVGAYNATIYYKGSGAISKVVFTRKEPTPGPTRDSTP